jgi:hypothetical protein
MFDGPFIYCCALHTNQEMILIIDKEDEHVLA